MVDDEKMDRLAAQMNEMISGKFPDAAFVLLQNGTAQFDVAALREIAARKDSMTAFLAYALLDVMEKGYRGELKGVKPQQLFITLAKAT